MDSRLSIVVLTDSDVVAWFTELPQNIDAFLSINQHGMRLWEHGKEKKHRYVTSRFNNSFPYTSLILLVGKYHH